MNLGVFIYTSDKSKRWCGVVQPWQAQRELTLSFRNWVWKRYGAKFGVCEQTALHGTIEAVRSQTPRQRNCQNVLRDTDNLLVLAPL